MTTLANGLWIRGHCQVSAPLAPVAISNRIRCRKPTMSDMAFPLEPRAGIHILRREALAAALTCDCAHQLYTQFPAIVRTRTTPPSRNDCRRPAMTMCTRPFKFCRGVLVGTREAPAHHVLLLSGAYRRCRIRCPGSGISGTKILERSSLPAHPIRDHARNETGNRHRFRCTRSQDKCRHVSTHGPASLGDRQRDDTLPTSVHWHIFGTTHLSSPHTQLSPIRALPHIENDNDLKALCRLQTSTSRRDSERPHAGASSRPDRTSALNAPHAHITRTTILSASY